MRYQMPLKETLHNTFSSFVFALTAYYATEITIYNWDTFGIYGLGSLAILTFAAFTRIRTGDGFGITSLLLGVLISVIPFLFQPH